MQSCESAITTKKGEKIMKNEKTIEVKPIVINTATITIVGDSDLILNKMDYYTEQLLIDARNDRSKSLEKPNEWGVKITKMRWRDGTPTEWSEEGFEKALRENAPCISAFGLKKSFGQAVVRNEIDKYSTKFDAVMNISAKANLVPIRFTEHYYDEKLMSPKKGSPVLTKQNRFSGWSADITITYLDSGSFSLEQIIQVINLAGFSMGIGSGRSSGFGRYHVQGVTK